MKIISVGKKPPRWLAEPLDDYSRRLQAVWRPEWLLFNIHLTPAQKWLKMPNPSKF